MELKSLFKYFGEDEKEEETLEIVSTFDLGEIENAFTSIKEEGQAALGIIGGFLLHGGIIQYLP